MAFEYAASSGMFGGNHAVSAHDDGSPVRPLDSRLGERIDAARNVRKRIVHLPGNAVSYYACAIRHRGVVVGMNVRMAVLARKTQRALEEDWIDIAAV